MIANLLNGLKLLVVVAVVGCWAIATADDDPAANADGHKHEAKDADESHENDGDSKAAHGEDDDHGHGGHGGHGHNEHDLSHGNAGEMLEKPNELRTELAVYSFVVFFCLMLLLMTFAWKPINEALAKREETIASSIEEAKQAATKGEEMLKQYEAKLAAAAEETREIVAQAKRDAEATKERIVTEAKEAAARERERAVEDIQRAKDVAIQELAAKSVDTAVALAGRMLRKEVDSKAHNDLIEDALAQFPSQN